MDIAGILHQSRVIPVVVIPNAGHAVSLARALVAGGLPVIEVTLRTDAALEAVHAIRSELPEALVGVGTVVARGQFAQAVEAGASFAVSPGLTPMLAGAAREAGLPFLPTASRQRIYSRQGT